MNPLTIENYKTNPLTYLATSKSKFLGWIKATPEGWEVRPSNKWKVCKFEIFEKAKRYLIATLKKTK